MRRREPKLIYLNHATLPVPNEAAARCSNRLLGDDFLVREIWRIGPRRSVLDSD